MPRVHHKKAGKDYPSIGIPVLTEQNTNQTTTTVKE
jgi:hypothetical protein